LSEGRRKTGTLGQKGGVKKTKEKKKFTITVSENKLVATTTNKEGRRCKNARIVKGGEKSSSS